MQKQEDNSKNFPHLCIFHVISIEFIQSVCIHNETQKLSKMVLFHFQYKAFEMSKNFVANFCQTPLSIKQNLQKSLKLNLCLCRFGYQLLWYNTDQTLNQKYFKGHLSNSLITIADKNLMQSFLKDKVQNSLAAIFLLLFLSTLSSKANVNMLWVFLFLFVSRVNSR